MNVNKLLIVYFVYPCRLVVAFVYLSIRYFILHFVVACLLLCAPICFILTLLLYFCLFVKHVYKPNIFVFGDFVYHFKNSISVIVCKTS